MSFGVETVRLKQPTDTRLVTKTSLASEGHYEFCLGECAEEAVFEKLPFGVSDDILLSGEGLRFRGPCIFTVGGGGSDFCVSSDLISLDYLKVALDEGDSMIFPHHLIFRYDEYGDQRALFVGYSLGIVYTHGECSQILHGIPPLLFRKKGDTYRIEVCGWGEKAVTRLEHGEVIALVGVRKIVCLRYFEGGDDKFAMLIKQSYDMKPSVLGHSPDLQEILHDLSHSPF
ncbi:MAG: hypothetical protein ACFFDI_14325 [Promethearchaeota archaeon]